MQRSGGPRRGPSSFLLFLNEHRRVVKEQQPHLESQDVSRLCGTVWQGMSDDEKKPWNEKARERREQLQEEYQENDPVVPTPQASSGYATRGSGALVSENMGPVEWSVGCVTFVDAAAQMAAASMAAAAHERDKIQMNNLGAPVDNEARGLISELGIMGNPFKVWTSHNVYEPNIGAESAEDSEDDWNHDRPQEGSNKRQRRTGAGSPYVDQYVDLDSWDYSAPHNATPHSRDGKPTGERIERADRSWRTGMKFMHEWWATAGAGTMPTKSQNNKLYQWCLSQRCAYRNEQSLKRGEGLVTGTQRISADKIQELEAYGFVFVSGPGSGN